jgi:hypothetical protein
MNCPGEEGVLWVSARISAIILSSRPLTLLKPLISLSPKQVENTYSPRPRYSPRSVSNPATSAVSGTSCGRMAFMRRCPRRDEVPTAKGCSRRLGEGPRLLRPLGRRPTGRLGSGITGRPPRPCRVLPRPGQQICLPIQGPTAQSSQKSGHRRCRPALPMWRSQCDTHWVKIADACRRSSPHSNSTAISD